MTLTLNNSIIGYKAGIYVIRVDGIGNYYGESNDIKRRWAQHRKQLYTGKHHCIKLRRAFRYLGPNAVHFEILEQSDALETSKQLRLLKESALIKADPLCLNTAISEADKVTVTSLPNRPVYRNRTVCLTIIRNTNLVLIKTERQGNFLGVEELAKHMRLGTFVTDEQCRLKRIK